MRLLCLDVGERRIGLALSDADERLAYGHGVLRRGSLNEDLAQLARLVAEEGVGTVVVGLPRGLDGSVGRQAERVQRFAERLAERISVPLVFWDERLSTVAALRDLREAGVSGRARREHVDERAATLILESYLGFRRNQAGDGTTETGER